MRLVFILNLVVFNIKNRFSQILGSMLNLMLVGFQVKSVNRV